MLDEFIRECNLGVTYMLPSEDQIYFGVIGNEADQEGCNLHAGRKPTIPLRFELGERLAR